jgi:hypothetical protein
MQAAPHVVARSDHIATLLSGVAASLIGECLQVHPVPLALPHIGFTMNWHRRNDAHPAQRWMRGIIGEIAMSALPGAAFLTARDPLV